MADLSGMFGTIDTALGNGGASPKPQTDSAGSQIGPNDIVVHTPPMQPKIVQGQAPAGDPNAVASPSANAIYTGGQVQPAAPPQKTRADDVLSAIDAAIATPTKPAQTNPTAD